MNAVVVGSGVVGASIAYHLRREGVAVTLLDRARPAAAPSASWASAGGLRSQGRHAAEQAISRAAAARWATLEQELEADLEVRRGGHLHVAETEDEITTLDARIAADRAGGIAVDRVAGADLRRVAPALRRSICVGALTPDDGQAHPGRTARAFAEAAARLGARCLFDAPARLRADGPSPAGVEVGGERLGADTVVLAAGAWSVGILAGLGLALPVRWRGLQMLLSDVAPHLLDPTVTAVGRNLSLKQAPSGQIMIGGRWFARALSDEPAVAPADAQVERQWCTALALLPALSAQTLAQTWAGAEAQVVDGLPLIGPAEPVGLYLATGFSNHGFQIAPEIGRLVAAEIAGRPQPALEPFRPGRFGSDGAACSAFRAEPCPV